MSIRGRIIRLERGAGRPPTCPEHEPNPLRPRPFDYRAGLAILSPDDAERQAAEAEQDAAIQAALEAAPCPRCGWRPPVPIAIRSVDLSAGWSTLAEDDHDPAAGTA
jgi:hypothetical protein